MTAAILPTLELAGDPGPARDLWAAAAVRESFQPEVLLDSWLAAHGDAQRDEQRQAMRAALDLQAACLPSADEDIAAVQLPNPQRLQVLELVGAETAQRTLSALEPTDRTLTEQLLQAILAGETVPVNRDDQAQLLALSRVAPWAAAAGAKLSFEPDEIDQHIARIDFLRTAGGADLHRFVGRNSLQLYLRRRWASDEPSQPVLIDGPGGIGKSLAITRFIADVLESSEPSLRPDAVFHIDFDRLSLQQARPVTILQEFVRQAARWWARKDSELLLALTRDVSAGDAGLEITGSTIRSIEANRSDYYLAHRLVSTLAGRKEGPPRVILFIDTFEQVETFNDSAAYSTRAVAKLLVLAGARLLQIYASRAFARPRDLSGKRSIRLRQFSVAEAETYLRNEAARAGFEIGANVARRVREAVGRSPLALRLAVGILEKEQTEFNPEDWSELARDDPESIQATLYDRFLRRIRNQELRKIARPGLLVRRLTEDVITKVLAEPCGLDLGKTSPQQLMEDARLEGQLFSADVSDPDALRHRQDVRGIMLANLDASLEERLAREINERAIAYYFTQGESLIYRTEELYHRLRLDQSSQEIDGRWTDEAGRGLRPALKEFPPKAQSFLRRKLGAASLEREGSERLAGMSRTAQHEDSDRLHELRQITRQQIQSGFVSQALLARLEEEGVERLDGPLVDIFFELLAWQGRHDELLDRARSLLIEAHHRIAPDTLARIHSTAAALLEGRESLSEAETFWLAALRAAQAFGADPLLELSCRTGALRIRRKLGTVPALRKTELDRAASLCAAHRADVFERRVLARETAAELSEILLEKRTYNDFGKPAYQHYAIQRLVDFVLRTNEAFPSAVDNPARLAELAKKFNGQEFLSLHQLNDFVAQLILGNAQDVAQVVYALREEVDWTLREAAGRSVSGAPASPPARRGAAP
ncbi:MULTISPECIES: hypothetical protein [Mesorhizobium]|uniref:hypothetical protein n=1 Tax=Mesorhizobium TaxID=68287 RepID=UPI000801B10A|nr:MULTISPECIES: hypothetical protein [Mesorhizobium]MUT27345.1 hypothetical protein [Mesorhizobium japonicum]OBQ82370.1 hypothetical protein A9K71_26380 [Mesorhizobium sp. WSM3873]